MKKFIGLLCILSIMELIAAQSNYQSRIVYFNETVNVCSYNPQSDIIRLNIKLEGFPLLEVDQWGWSMCNNF